MCSSLTFAGTTEKVAWLGRIKRSHRSSVLRLSKICVENASNDTSTWRTKTSSNETKSPASTIACSKRRRKRRENHQTFALNSSSLPPTFLDQVYLGDAPKRECEPKNGLVDDCREMFESRISAGGTGKLPASGRVDANITAWSYDLEGHAKKSMQRYCELANEKTSSSHRSLVLPISKSVPHTCLFSSLCVSPATVSPCFEGTTVLPMADRVATNSLRHFDP